MIIFSRRLQSNYSLSLALSLTLLCYLQTIQAINALTSPSDRHNYKKTEQCNSSIQDGLFEHSVTLLSYPSPCLRGNFSPQKKAQRKGRVRCSLAQRAPQTPARKPSPRLVLGDACCYKTRFQAQREPIPGTRNTQHTPKPNFQDLNSRGPGQSPGNPRVDQKREMVSDTAKAVCLGFGIGLCVCVCVRAHLCTRSHDVHCGSLAPAKAPAWAQKDGSSAPQEAPEKPRGLRAFSSSVQAGTAPAVTFGIRTAPQSSGWESNGAGLSDINGLGRHAN